MQLNPYVMFNGNCEEAFKFYERSLGGKIEAMMMHAGTPAAEQVPAEWQHKVLHARMSLNGQVIMASDAPPGRQSSNGGFFLSLGFTDTSEAERVFNTLAENGLVHMPLQQTFWAERFGMVNDQFGVPWMVNCGEPPPAA